VKNIELKREQLRQASVVSDTRGGGDV